MCFKNYLNCILFLNFFYALSVQGQEVNRTELHHDAIEKLSKTNFFKNGKGMVLPANLINLVDKSAYIRSFSDQSRLKNRFGLIADGKKFKGLFTEKYKDSNFGVLGCIFCHGGRAAGQYIPGLGNKNVDVYQIGKDLNRLYKYYKFLPIKKGKDKEFFDILQNSKKFAKVLSNKQISNSTVGLVPIAMIRYWFYSNNNLEIPSDLTSGAVKVPQFWGYGEKRKVGQFCDGGGNGNLPGWGAAVELAAGQDPEALLDPEYIEKLNKIEDLIGNILPPKYPFEIIQVKANAGQALFEQICAKCHGNYENDANGLPIYQAPKHIPIGVVQTDDDRLKGNTPLFYKLVKENPLSSLVQANFFKPGYFAPRLEGIWSRFPYLHNGSVPNLYELLSIPEERSKVFSLKDAGELNRFDKTKLGLTTEHIGTHKYKKMLRSKKRYIYKTEIIGQSNSGHINFGILSESEKGDLIEYLKTL